MEVWSFLETDGGGRRLHATAPQMATESRRLAQRLGVTPGAFLVGTPGGEELSRVEPYGLQTICARGNGLAHQTLDSCEESVVRWWLGRRPQVLLWAATPLGAELAARVAARMSAGFIANVVDYEGGRPGALRVRCSAFQNKAHLLFSLTPDRPWVLTIPPSSLEALPAARAGKEAQLVREDHVLCASEF